MHINTLVIGFTPLTDITNKKPRELRDDTYFKELFARFDLGEVHYATYSNWQGLATSLDPVFIITFNDYYAQQIKDYKKDSLIYVTYDPGQIFYRKAEMETKKEKQLTVLTEIAGMVKKVRDDGEHELPALRKFAAMSYDDIYKMIIQMIISDDEKLKKKAWELLMNNNGHSNFIWMRAQLVVEYWQHSDAQGKYKMLTMTMQDYVDNYFAEELAIHTDEDGMQYRQYEFILPNSERTYYIRRIPIPPKGMEKYAYESLLDKYETPNGARMMMEIGQTKSKVKEYTDIEAEKIYLLLKRWQENPKLTCRELNIIDHDGHYRDEVLSDYHVNEFKKILKAWGEEKYNELFVVAEVGK